jgi:hypothetical protein
LKAKPILFFILLFFAIAYFMSMANPYLPNTGNSTFNYLESGGISAFLIIVIWEKWLRKESGETRDG